MGRYEIKKIPSCFDNKRFVRDDGINMLAYFDKNIDSHKRQRFKKILIKSKNSHG